MLDTVFRQIEILRMIPLHPRRIAVTEIHKRLVGDDYEITIRSIQRDLRSLSGRFAITGDDAKPQGWSWIGEPILIPTLDPQTALTFSLVEQFLRPVLPKATLSAMEPHFKSARNVLSSTRKLEAWPEKVRILPRGLSLQPPRINAEVQNVIYDALFTERKVRMKYFPRGDQKSKDYDVHPLGIVVRDQVIYLVCTLWDYEDVIQLALHRIREAELLDEPASRPKDFNLDGYIREGAFGYKVSESPIQLRVLFEEGAALHLHETPLSKDQVLTRQADGRELLEATVLDTSELRWWLLGFGSGVEVLEPKELRDEFRTISEDMARLYLKLFSQP
jgi:predicted DNA-binding transcriptional regulator YafY